MTRYTHLVKMVTNATDSAHKKPPNLPLALSFLYAGFFQFWYRRIRSAKSTQATVKRRSDTIWNIRPASMRWLPRSMVLVVVADDVTPLW